VVITSFIGNLIKSTQKLLYKGIVKDGDTIKNRDNFLVWDWDEDSSEFLQNRKVHMG
jgi:hypothetical protein